MQKLAKYLQGDRVIWGIVFILFIISILAVYSASSFEAKRSNPHITERFLLSHFVFTLIGVFIMYVAHRIPYRLYAKAANPLLLFSIGLLFAAAFFGTTTNASKRWINFAGISLQPSEVAKLALLIYLAKMIASRQSELHSLTRGFLPLIIPVVIVFILIVPSNLSTALLIVAISSILMFIAHVPLRFLAAAYLVLFLGGIGGVWVMDAVSGVNRMQTWKNRVIAFASTDGEQKVKSLTQSDHAKIAIQQGGFTGVGPGKSGRKQYLYSAYADFLYAIVIEEYGLILGIVIMFLYFLLMIRSLLIVIHSPGTFGALLACGLAISMLLQALTHMAVSVSLLPVTGQTLPLMSKGGSSMIFTCIALGIILSVSRSSRVVKDPETKTMSHAAA